MRHLLIATFGLALFLVTADGGRSQDPAPAPTKVSGAKTWSPLLPKDPLAAVRADSLDGLEAGLKRIAGAFDDKAASKIQLGAMAAGMSGLDPAALDRSRPCWVGVAAGESEPQIVLILPLKAGATVPAQADRPEGAPAVRAVGDHVTVAMSGPYEAAAPAGVFATPPPDGDVVARVDVVRAVDAYGEQFFPMLDMVMEMAKAGQEQPEAAATMDSMAAGIREFIESSESWDLSLRIEGTRAALEGVATWKPAAAKNLPGILGKTDLGGLARRLPRDYPISAAVAITPGAWKNLKDWFGKFAAQMPEPQRAAFAKAMEHFDGTTRHMGEGMVLGIDFAGGVKGVMVFEAKDADGYIASIRKMHETVDFSSTGVKIAPWTESEVEGVKVHRTTMTFDVEKMLEAQKAAGPDPVKFRAAVEAMLGKDGMRMSVAAQGAHVVMLFGGDDATMAAALGAAKEGKGPGAPSLTAAVRGAGADAGAVLTMDLRALLSAVAGVAAAAGGPMKVPAGAPVNVVMSIGATDRTVRGRLVLDAAALGALVKDMQK